MARQNGLLEVLHPPTDADYVAHFQQLAALNLDLRREGPTPERLLQKSRLEAAVGNYTAARQAAADAVAQLPLDAEARFQAGVCSLLVALSETGVVEWPLTEPPEVSLHALVQEAHVHLAQAAAANAADAEATELAACVERLLARCPDDAALRAALLRTRRCTTASRRPSRPVRQD